MELPCDSNLQYTYMLHTLMNIIYICNATHTMFKVQLGIVIALEETITCKVMRNYHLD
jgi:hypothetical protein